MRKHVHVGLGVQLFGDELGLLLSPFSRATDSGGVAFRREAGRLVPQVAPGGFCGAVVDIVWEADGGGVDLRI